MGHGTPVQSCEDRGMFECVNGACVPVVKVNNSVNDCGDNSDEGKIDVCDTLTVKLVKSQ